MFSILAGESGLQAHQKKIYNEFHDGRGMYILDLGRPGSRKSKTGESKSIFTGVPQH
jgi:hypothetical protein